jgi:hypothetical protein
MLRQSLSTLPPTLDETYDRILSAISKEYSQYAIRILRWLTFSARPLSIEEIAEVVAIDVNCNPAFNRDEVFEDPLEALNICSSLVTITADNGNERARPVTQFVRLTHYSVKEYLLSHRILTGGSAQYGMQATACHGAMAKGCLKYLLQFHQPESFSEEVFKKFKLARYSAEF